MHGRGLKQTSSVTPRVVPTQCIQRGLQPLRQPRWHLSQVQNLFLELFVVKLQSALEISTQNLPAHKCPPIVRFVCLHTCVSSFLSRNNPAGTDQVQGPLLECRGLSRSVWWPCALVCSEYSKSRKHSHKLQLVLNENDVVRLGARSPLSLHLLCDSMAQVTLSCVSSSVKGHSSVVIVPTPVRQ